MPKNSDFNNFDPDRLEEADNSWLSLEIYVRAEGTELLQGLEEWLRLGLISQEQVKQLARRRFSCALPLQKDTALPVVAEVEKTAPVLTTPIAPNLFQTIVRSFLDELSIRWLLFLGIFLVVVSSGVLAASQWQNFADFGQYLVLLVYTLGFWGIGFWTGKQSGLRLTSQTLTAIATLLIPINFWAINYLGLRDNYLEWAIASVAAVVLTGINYVAVKSNQRKRSPLLTLLFGLLSYAHLGWQIPSFPLVAIYGGIVAICGIERQFLRRRRKYPVIDLLHVFAAWSLLLARNLVNATDDLAEYSLAIAIFAWLIGSIYLTQVQKIKLIALKRKSAAITNAFLGKVGKVLGIMLFIAAWSMSILAGIFDSPLFFAQTVGISILAIHLFYQRLILYWYKRDLTAIFLIGLQAVYVCKELIPERWRGQALDLAVEVSKTEYFPESVLGITLFPYVVIFVFVASWLYRRRKTSLAIYTEFLTLCLGIVLTCLSFTNPTWRSLNLFCSTLTLAYAIGIRQPIRSSLVYFTHLLGLATVINAIALMTLDRVTWGIILLAIAAAEWLVCIYLAKRRLKPLAKMVEQSCWYFGLGISAVSYTFLSLENDWGLIWLTIPAMLTIVAKYTRNIQQRRLATVFSCLFLIAAQLLLIRQPDRTIALFIATGLMYFNVFNLRRTFVVVIHLGFAIALVLSGFDLFIGNSTASYGYWLLVGGAIVILLYRLRLSLQKTIDAPKSGYISQRTAFGILGVGREAKNYKLVGKYIRAADYWAIALIAIESLVFITVYLLLPVVRVNEQFILNLVAIALIIGALVWRYSSQPNNLVLYTLTGLLGMLATGLVRLLFNSNLALATCNIMLGVMVAVVVLSQSNTARSRLNLAYVPLVYAVMGIFWRLSNFNAYTGLLTLGAAFIALNTYQQNRQINRTIKYFGFAGISCGIYELVIYQMQSQSGGSNADALTILALVAAAIAFCYRLIAWKQRSTIFGIDRSKLVLIAHIHWVISSLLKIVAAGITLETTTPRLTLVSIATSFCLGAYAVIQGRSTVDDKPNDWWVYVGLVEISATLVYSRLIISKLSLFDPWRIVFTCAVALLIYQIPWQNFGWRSTPWQRTALIIPVLMALVTAEDISYFSLLITAAFYLRIAYAGGNIRIRYISLGLLNWLGIRLIAQYNLASIWLAAMICLSILYIAQLDSYLQCHQRQRHYLRLFGSSIFCLTALLEQPGIVPGAIAFCFIFAGLGLRIRAFLFTGTVTLILTVLHQLIILVFTYSFLKWVVGLLTGISSIAIAAGFEQKRERVFAKLKSYRDRLQDWQ